jgi:nitrogen fixation/metabolism regulation signal transduction histidine kinase
MRVGRTIAIVLVMLAIVPLGAAVYLLDEVMGAADRVSAGEAKLRADALEKARAAYRELFAERKAALHEKADRLTKELATLDGSRREDWLVRQIAADPALKSVKLGALEKSKFADGRELRIDEGELSLVYVTPRAPFDAFEQLGNLESSEAGLELVHTRLRGIYRAVFSLAFFFVVGVALTIGLILGRRLSRRIGSLAEATRAVGQGDLAARVSVEGKDELADLGRAFNQMVKELAENRDRISYLQKIGAWQEVARRLAHEIKNPLTPIQLAMQQLQSSYSGADEEFKKALATSNEIVAEEIGSLRRLVHEFSTFAKLPSVQKAPIAAATLIDDLVKSDPELQVGAVEKIEVQADRMLLKQALYNLILNAREAGAKTVRISFDGGFVVDDDGPGVPSLPIFDPYVTTKEHGTGLGLAIVRKIALEHGGDVTVEKSPLGGARFKLRLA